MFNTPILYIVFNRPELVKQSLSKIKEIAPKKLYVAADGPRKNNEEDKEKCLDVLKLIKKAVDWDCNVEYLVREENLGCGKAVSSAISWFFNNEPEGIILEDDCVPNISFFRFCQEMLAHHRYNQCIFQIAGSNWQKNQRRGKADYYYSHITSVWGWATWRDRWELYDYNIKVDSDNFYKVKRNLSKIAYNQKEVEYHLNCFKQIAVGNIDTWDYQWRFLVFLHLGKNVIPNVNLIANSGFGADGTHTFDISHWRSNLSTEQIVFPLKHPRTIKVNKKGDTFLAKNIWLNEKIENAHFLDKILKEMKRLKKKVYG